MAVRVRVRMTVRGREVEGGGRRVESGERRVEGGGWKVEGGERRIEGGGRRARAKRVSRRELMEADMGKGSG